MPNLEVHCYPLGFIETNAFLILNKESNEALLVDAPHDSYELIQRELQKHNCKLVGVVITHGHWDHMGEASRFQEEGIPIYAHKADQAWIENPKVFVFFLPEGVPPIHPVKIDHFLEDGQVIEFLGENVEIRHVPGHAPGNILLYFANQHWAFVGDVIFAGSVGRYDLPGSNAKDLIRSIKKKIFTLPAETTIYSGHGPETTVGQEKASNPFIQGD